MTTEIAKYMGMDIGEPEDIGVEWPDGLDNRGRRRKQSGRVQCQQNDRSEDIEVKLSDAINKPENIGVELLDVTNKPDMDVNELCDIQRNGGIFYASDLHINYNFYMTKRQRRNMISDLVDTFAEDGSQWWVPGWCPLLLAGDISDDLDALFFFCDLLAERWQKGPVCIVAGNHDLGLIQALYDTETASKILKYREHGIYVLCDELLYIDVPGDYRYLSVNVIPLCDIEKMTYDDLNYMLRNSVCCVYGIHDMCDPLDKPVLPDFMLRCLSQRNSVLMCHEASAFFSPDCLGPFDMVQDWSEAADGIIRVWGHGHQNQAHDDGVIRCYADNQFGYWLKNWKPGSKMTRHLKFAHFEVGIDPLSYLHDGIHHISASEYGWFLQCIGLYGSCSRFQETGVVCVKRDGVYCFMRKGKSDWTILNGGQIRRTGGADPERVYEKMPEMVAAINCPMSQFSKYLDAVSEAVKRFGGSGRVHGCLVDIDFFDHIYVNPFDGTLTPYFATDIVKKIVYPDMPTLLGSTGQEQLAALESVAGGIDTVYIDPMRIDQCRNGFLQKYLAISQNDRLMLGNGNSGPDKFAISKTAEMKDFPDVVTKLSSPAVYTSTDIYAASRAIFKMQKLQKSVLALWDENAIEASKNKQNLLK